MNWSLVRISVTIIVGFAAFVGLAVESKADPTKYALCAAVSEAADEYGLELRDCDLLQEFAVQRCALLSQGYTYGQAMSAALEEWPLPVAASVLGYSMKFYCPEFAPDSVVRA